MISDHLNQWLIDHADLLDSGHINEAELLPKLAAAEVFKIGVPTSRGGVGGEVADSVEAIAQVASQSLAAAFVFWGHRAFIEYLLQGDNPELRDRLLPSLLSGELAGATGLSNAMKYLAGIESLGIAVRKPINDSKRLLDGVLPWATNLRKEGFVVAAAVEVENEQPLIAALPSHLSGINRSDDLDLIALRASNTASIKVENASLTDEWVISHSANTFLPRVRPAFLAMQCGMSIGLARRCLVAAKQQLGPTRSALRDDYEGVDRHLSHAGKQLQKGLSKQRFIKHPAELFAIRLTLAEVVANASQLELQASGGKAYVNNAANGFVRRWREAAFIPIITPSVVQLKAELLLHQEAIFI
ncbi:MAG: acyl-CoA/acyl-ACP dehydrogenase [Halomonas sp.]|nr:acyl-CoA dehydrogenase family protein [Halomonas sp.]MCC5900849.1 acyl-CoA/acyl-ACP dehydrogenase [Halomonas sp.]